MAEVAPVGNEDHCKLFSKYQSARFVNEKKIVCKLTTDLKADRI